MSGNKPHNPHASAAGTYGRHAQVHTPDQREMEARVLLKAANKMQELQKDWDAVSAEMLDEVLRFNRQIWMMFVDTAVEDDNPARPKDLRSNIANLGIFIFNRTVEVLSKPEKEKLNILIEINREIAAGLMTKQEKSGADAQAQK
ncbi:MAG TPA: flagellar biosynthesis regulator FlaF [Alphaproteobacteria bacterium]|jgi:flagellar protein FlaF